MARPAAAPIPLQQEPARTPAPDYDDDDTSPYAVLEESEEERRLAEINKPKFTDLKDKFAKSARGPAMSLLVMPTNLMIAQGTLCILVGLATAVIGFWPIVFSDLTPSAEELRDQLYLVFVGVFTVLWGGLTCYGAAQMQNLNSYSWGMATAILAILPLLAGVFAVVTLRDPRVLAGFREPETGPIAVNAEEEDDEEYEDDEEEEEYDDEYEDDD